MGLPLRTLASALATIVVIGCAFLLNRLASSGSLFIDREMASAESFLASLVGFVRGGYLVVTLVCFSAVMALAWGDPLSGASPRRSSLRSADPPAVSTRPQSDCHLEIKRVRLFPCRSWHRKSAAYVRLELVKTDGCR